MLCCGYTLTDFPISIRLTSLALWQSNDCPSASKATVMNMDKYLMWIHYERLYNHNKAKHNKTVCIFLGIYCTSMLLLLIHAITVLSNYNLNYVCLLSMASPLGSVNLYQRKRPLEANGHVVLFCCVRFSVFIFFKVVHCHCVMIVPVALKQYWTKEKINYPTNNKPRPSIKNLYTHGINTNIKTSIKINFVYHLKALNE